MTHPLIDECAVPMAVHAAEVRRVRAAVLHRDRPTEDPAGAPSGLRWEANDSRGESWSLRVPVPGRHGSAVGHVYRLPEWADRRRMWVRHPAGHPAPRYGTLHEAAEDLVRCLDVGITPSGLRWVRGKIAPWLLGRRGAAVGCLIQYGPAWEARLYYRRRGRGIGYLVVHSGALADCARALAREVRRG